VCSLQVHGDILGEMLFLTSNTERPFDSFDLCLAEEVAHLAALAIDNAKLYQEAQRAVKMRQDLLAVVSHELRNSLTSVILSAQMLDRPKVQVSDSSVLKKFTKRILNSGAQMQRLIHDLLDQAKIESKCFSISKSRQEISSFLKSVWETLSPIAQESQIDLVLNEPTGAFETDFDRDRITQVISNLVTNAIKFSPAKSQISIGASSTEKEVLFFVKDQGRGISPAQLPHLFERYWQAEESSKIGNGLGLSIAKDIVIAHHGHIWAESVCGLGTNFFFTLPAV
jgi:signal transduction histidine kinase